MKKRTQSTAQENGKLSVTDRAPVYRKPGHYSSVADFMNSLEEKNRGQSNFLESVEEVLESVWHLLQQRRDYLDANILERMTEPERTILFRVPWIDEQGGIRVNRGYRVEFNSAIGPYKGGLRFHSSVNLDILKFLGFEQTIKNSLTTLPMGGGKGGSDFNPKGRSDLEVMRFCQSFMSELYRHIGERTDVPAGDIGVGSREIGYLFGQYKRLKNRFDGSLTGKGIHWGGSPLRAEATGYGVIYFLEEMLRTRQESIDGKRVCISGAGNVAQFAAEKTMQNGGKVVSLSDSGGTVSDPDGLDEEKLEFVKKLKNQKRGSLREFADTFRLEYLEDERPWQLRCDVALPCATQNEISAEDADCLIENGCLYVAEGANKPSTPGALKRFRKSGILFAPGKAANAGGVAVSGLEMSQNGMNTQWSRKKVDEKLRKIMRKIHEQCVQYGDDGEAVDYIHGANLAGFVKVAESMVEQGVV